MEPYRREEMKFKSASMCPKEKMGILKVLRMREKSWAGYFILRIKETYDKSLFSIRSSPN